MIYSGKAITVRALDNGIAELCFDLADDSVNKFNQLTLAELKDATAAVAADKSIKGLLVTSGKDCFIVGADITEFGANFSKSEEDIAAEVFETNKIFNAVEDLPIPTVTAINGVALGGGLEMALATDYRVLAEGVKIGLPEVKLGIMPGFGGSVRLPRIIGADNAIEWIAGGSENRAEKAFADGAVDALVAPALLRDAAIDLLNRAISGELDYKAKRQEKLEKLKINDIESLMVFETAKGFVAGKAGKHYPAPVTAVKSMQKNSTLGRDDALKVEAASIGKLAKTGAAASLVSLFLGDQMLMKKGKKQAAGAKKIEQGAVLGAGIMGGGIAYQSAYKGTPIMMKDIAQAGLDLGMGEAAKLLSKLVERGRMTTDKMAKVLTAITPTLSYEGIDKADVVVEAVVENPKVKHAVLAEVEGKMRADAILSSNTSTISIDYLAQPLKRPENFCGMHFFNPVHKMPLVEVIRGAKTSDTAVAATVGYALAMGKKPVVVRDCPGFLVNRILSPYMGCFMQMVNEGADFVQIDKVMEKFGWPMGPAYLCDVVGIDTGVHAGETMSEGFPDRMKYDFKTASEVLYEAKRFGQKNGKGYYAYELDKKGRQKKVADESVWALLKDHVAPRKDVSDEEITERLMVSLCLEAVRCLEDGIVDSATELDMALIYGIGFPPFLGGAIRYMESMGLANFVAIADKYAHLGGLYKVTDQLRAKAEAGQSYFA
ncbi:fatty acid oxidation complex subunit alpha FadB [Simiduia agarivorans]|uniref:enoyl-CoA hydratase n=1 Tax=Simiduia agarivorans (strain DSM 21679 / JCM 13881 / BCRC 17597 / SA1) TaxID=1117647 RepID=K4KRC4_SIMAS|nr:fatty acid oxidation complex subunit alpha FadB [Simiduia agarivorans]AFV00836.1 multifunctional fatty acid oxidation complex subunit alpha [Simiduia agarivorans SA1 = DSM 21679]